MLRRKFWGWRCGASECRPAEARFDNCVRAGAGAPRRSESGEEKLWNTSLDGLQNSPQPSGARPRPQQPWALCEGKGRRSGIRERNNPSPCVMVRMQRAGVHPALPTPHCGAPGVAGPGAGAPARVHPFAPGWGNFASPGTRGFKSLPAPSFSLLSNSGPPPCSPPKEPGSLAFVRSPSRCWGEDRRGSQGPCPHSAEEESGEMKMGKRGLQSALHPWSDKTPKGEEGMTPFCLPSFPKFGACPASSYYHPQEGWRCGGRPGCDPMEAAVGWEAETLAHAHSPVPPCASDRWPLGRVIRRPAMLSPQPFTLCGSPLESAVSSVCKERPNDWALGRPGAPVWAAQPGRAPAEQAELPPRAGVC